ncbi:MAG: CAP domain-containing protein [Thermomicrobiales bacterium]
MKRPTFATLFVVVALALLPLMRLGFVAPAPVAAAEAYCLDPNASAFLQLINSYRQQNGLQPYTASPTLGAAALAHSQDMATQDYSSHTGKDGSTPESRMQAAGYDTNQAGFTGENIYWGGGVDLGTAQAAFDWWRNSPGHNANMLSPNFTAIGIGVATNPATGKTHWTTTFGGRVDATATPCADANGNGGGNGNGNGNGNGGGNGNGNGGGMPATDTGTLTVTIHQCPPEANPEAGDFTHCLDIDNPNGLLINTTTNQSVPLSSAPKRPEMTHNYEWDALAVGTYKLDPKMPGKQWVLVNIGIANPQNHQDTFEVQKGQQTFVELFLYGSMVTPTPTPTPDAAASPVDTDGDGLYDDDEVNVYHTDPTKADTDGDGVDDGQEVYDGTNPLDPSSYSDSSNRKDSDGDGLYDDDEINIYHTDPNNPDTDGDGYDDGQEVYDGTNPLDPNSHGN